MQGVYCCNFLLLPIAPSVSCSWLDAPYTLRSAVTYLLSPNVYNPSKLHIVTHRYTSFTHCTTILRVDNNVLVPYLIPIYWRTDLLLRHCQRVHHVRVGEQLIT